MGSTIDFAQSRVRFEFAPHGTTRPTALHLVTVERVCYSGLPGGETRQETGLLYFSFFSRLVSQHRKTAHTKFGHWSKNLTKQSQPMIIKHRKALSFLLFFALKYRSQVHTDTTIGKSSSGRRRDWTQVYTPHKKNLTVKQLLGTLIDPIHMRYNQMLEANCGRTTTRLAGWKLFIRSAVAVAFKLKLLQCTYQNQTAAAHRKR